MKPLSAALAGALGLTAMLATPARGAINLGQSATFGVGAIVIDVCQVASAYRPYMKSPSRRSSPQCAAAPPVSGAAPEAVTRVTRGENGVVTAVYIEF